MYDEIVLKKLGKLFIVLLNECDSTEYEKISRKDLVKLIEICTDNNKTSSIKNYRALKILKKSLKLVINKELENLCYNKFIPFFSA
jgi:hypothetical protein